MPRVNRDLQRRMAARRERERRRPPGERRYQFGAPETPLDTNDAPVGAEDQATVEEVPARRVRRASDPLPATATPIPTRGGVRTHLPFSAYRAEYAYVLSDLRRVGLVIGSLLLILIVLYLVLPH